MKTMEEIDVWYELELNKAKLEGKIEIALNLLSKNMSLETIAEVTGLTIDCLRQVSDQRLQQLQASQVKD